MKIGWTEAQEKAIILPLGFTVVVTAGAGTGKTSVLSEVVTNRIICEKKLDITDVLVLTFTRKAAAEMAERIESRLIELAKETSDEGLRRHLLKAVNELPTAAISTIDSFAARLVREYASWIGLNSDFEVLDAHANDYFGEQVAQRCLEKWIVEPPHELWPELLRFVRLQGSWQSLLVKLDNHITTRGALTPGLLLAGKKYADANVETLLEQLLVECRNQLTVTVDSLIDALDKFESLLKQIEEDKKADGQFYSYAKSAQKILPTIPQLKTWLQSGDFSSTDEVIKLFDVWNFKWGGKIIPMAQSASKLGKKIRDAIKETAPGSLASIYLDLVVLPYKQALAEAIIEFHNAFLEARREKNTLSFSDCEAEALRLLREHPQIADEIRNRFKFAIVDEYQDINPLQHELICLLSSPSAEEGCPPGNLYVVGDARQSIYGFRDADFRLLKDLECSKGVRVEHLYDNFRARPELISFINAVFRKRWFDSNYTDLIAAFKGYFEDQNESAANSRISMYVIEADNTAEGRLREAEIIASRLQELIFDERITVFDKSQEKKKRRAIQWEDCAVLTRTRASLAIFEEIFAQAGIPFRTESGGGFWDRHEISDIRSLLYCLSPVSDNLDWAIFLRSPWVGLSDDSLIAIAKTAGKKAWRESWRHVEFINRGDGEKIKIFQDWFEKISNLAGRIPVCELIEKALEFSGYSLRVFAQKRAEVILANIHKLIHTLRESGPWFDPKSTADYISWLTSRGVTEGMASIPEAGEKGCITLATIHSAKGLEWPLVVIPDLNRKPKPTTDAVCWDDSFGLEFKWMDSSTGIPGKPWRFWKANNKQKDERIEEEIRLLYVALTRAREWLILSSSLKRKESDDELKWELNNGSLLVHIYNAITLYEKSLLGKNDSEPIEDVEFSTGSIGSGLSATSLDKRPALNVKFTRFIYRKEKKTPVRKLVQDVPINLIDKLKAALDRMPEKLPPSERQYMLSASEVSSFSICPRMFAYRYIWRVPNDKQGKYEGDEESDSDQIEMFELEPAQRGTLIHKILQEVRFDAGSEDIIPLAQKVIGEQIQPLTDQTRMAQHLSVIIENTLKLPIMKWIKECPEEQIKREVPLIGKIDGTDEIVKGIIDLLAFGNGRNVIVDYKTGIMNEGNIAQYSENYRIQLALYAILAGGRLKVAPESVETWIVNPGEPASEFRIELGNSEIERTIQIVKRMSEQCGMSQFDATPSPGVCAICDYNDICRESLAGDLR